MDARNYVKEKFPKTRLIKIKRRGRTYYVVKNKPSYTMVGIGRTKKEAWEAAKISVDSKNPL